MRLDSRNAAVGPRAMPAASSRHLRTRSAPATRSRPLQNARPSPRTRGARAPPASTASRLCISSRTMAPFMAFILSGRLSTSSAASAAVVRMTVRGWSDSGIRRPLLGGEDLQLAGAHRGAVRVEHVPAVRDQARLLVAVSLLDDLDVQVQRVADPCGSEVA